MRETNEEAWAAADRLISHLDEATIASAQSVFKRMDSVGQSRMAALHGGRRDKLEVSPNLWAGVGLVRGGAGTALVGDPETVAARMKGIHGARHRYLHPFRLPAPRGGLPLRRTGSAAPAARGGDADAGEPYRGEHGAVRRDDRQRPPPDREAGCSLMSRASLLARLQTAALAWALPVAVLVVWEIASRSGLLTPRLLPAPSAVAVAFWQHLLDGSLLQAILISSGRALKGLAIGGALGFTFGVMCGIWRPAETLFDSSMQMLRNIPHLAIIPLVILWFGIG